MRFKHSSDYGKYYYFQSFLPTPSVITLNPTYFFQQGGWLLGGVASTHMTVLLSVKFHKPTGFMWMWDRYMKRFYDQLFVAFDIVKYSHAESSKWSSGSLLDFYGVKTPRLPRKCNTVDVRIVIFPVSASFMTISNPALLSSSGTEVNPGIRSWKKHSNGWVWCQKAIGGIYFTKKWRAETQQPVLEFGKFQTQARKRYSNASPGWPVRLLGVMIGVFLKRESRPI